MRKLSGDEDYESPYLEQYDADGDAYSLAWRYLGAYIDDDGYSRKALWAAYYDADYSGQQIGEYAYYDWTDSSWDNSTCTDESPCSKMDCHDSESETWALVGVYKESLEFDNDTFFEQLFKHQSYCLWGGDNSDYQFMQTMRKEMANYDSCYNAASGIYIGAKPAEGGDLAVAVYSDSYCQTELSDYSADDYVSSSSGSSWYDAFDKWNGMMESHKTCQPCRAYSKYYNVNDDWSRHLMESSDGNGAEESNGFNCYDDAGFRNCNQCFKFETHSDMEEASTDDLELATEQGTIVSIDVDGVSYGGSYSSTEVAEEEAYGDSYTSSSYSATTVTSSIVVGFAVVIVGVLMARYRCKRRIITTEGDQPLDLPVLS